MHNIDNLLVTKHSQHNKGEECAKRRYNEQQLEITSTSGHVKPCLGLQSHGSENLPQEFG